MFSSGEDRIKRVGGFCKKSKQGEAIIVVPKNAVGIRGVSGRGGGG